VNPVEDLRLQLGVDRGADRDVVPGHNVPS
jgi:hypothetical protein